MDWLIEVNCDSGCFTPLEIVVMGGRCDGTEASRAAELTRATGSVFCEEETFRACVFAGGWVACMDCVKVLTAGSVFCILLMTWGVGRFFGISSVAPEADDAEQSRLLDSTVFGKGTLLDASG